MVDTYSLEQINQAAEIIRKRIPLKPRIGMILGSGLGSLVDILQNPIVIPYFDIPNWVIPTVEGHKGRLVAGSLSGQNVMILQGRAHFYEGYSMAEVTFPIRVMQQLGVEILIVTNAAGAVNPEFHPGDLMLIKDHLNLLGMAGQTPLRGVNLDELGPRFPDMSRAYDRELIDLARVASAQTGIHLLEGVYVCLAGPSFETPADLRFLRAVGVDAVGMSTVPEVTVARHANIRVLGISGISNQANLDGDTITTHQEVLQAGSVIVPKLSNLLIKILEIIPSAR
jgi:purine-nucleoside phosphorylase